MPTWLDQADELISLAEQAKAAGNVVVMIAALERAVDCIAIHRNLERAETGRTALSAEPRGEG